MAEGRDEPRLPLLRLQGVEAVYDAAIVALRGVSFDVPDGAIVALLGANGAGKTTTLKAASNLLRASNGALRAGDIQWRGQSIAGRKASRLVASGLVQVLEGRRCFAQLTVEENLLTGAFVRRLTLADRRLALERIYAWFPRLRERRRSRAGLTSGGEQQMVAIGRALMTGPRLVLLDEPSMGLAPRIVHEIFEIVRTLNSQEGVSFLVSEQNATIALRYASEAHVLEHGRIVVSGRAADLAQRDDIRNIYLGNRAAA